MGNSKDRKKERTEKELLALGRDAKQVRANALSMEEQVRAAAVTNGELRTQVSQLEIDRDAWKEQAVTTREAIGVLEKLAGEDRIRISKLNAGAAQFEESLAVAQNRVAELEEGLAEMPKLRRRLQEQTVKIADRDKKIASLEALLKRHERVAATETTMLAAVKGGAV